ncbi:DNA repair protein RecO [Siculibacillus lacustris]|uniref:DNA repair protein RecO n=1 Tax=Siculibacillus lacustris TaxID=1549641 RepID=A0A4V2KU32_9HYPH|nr:DNA repair protein RecO [Siculibacillus lacustris]TBW39741.1 DNA repair protein RecO [Siculibacillus lacustris]
MEWTDVGLVLGARRLGEADALVELMTVAHGRHLGVVKGGRSQRRAAGLQVGNSVRAVWRARLDEHVGTFAVETLDARGAALMADPLGLNAVQTLAAHFRLLPERDPHPDLLYAALAILARLDDPGPAAARLVRFELAVIEALGFGLDLTTCALTGTSDDLAWVSPATGRAAGRAAGLPWADRLLALPAFLVAAPIEAARDESPPLADLLAGFRLTGHFLARHVWEARGIDPPATREGFLAALARVGAKARA